MHEMGQLRVGTTQRQNFFSKIQILFLYSNKVIKVIKQVGKTLLERILILKILAKVTRTVGSCVKNVPTTF